MTRIEHANLTVPDIDEAIKFFKIVAPDFKVRRDEKPMDGIRWVHIGNDRYYFALQEPHLGSDPKNRHRAYKNYGINHLALVVSNLESIEKKLVNAGYKQSIETPEERYRKRIYYFDKAGFEWELVEYFTEKLSEKFLYE